MFRLLFIKVQTRCLDPALFLQNSYIFFRIIINKISRPKFYKYLFQQIFKLRLIGEYSTRFGFRVKKYISVDLGVKHFAATIPFGLCDQASKWSWFNGFAITEISPIWIRSEVRNHSDIIKIDLLFTVPQKRVNGKGFFRSYVRSYFGKYVIVQGRGDWELCDK